MITQEDVATEILQSHPGIAEQLAYLAEHEDEMPPELQLAGHHQRAQFETLTENVAQMLNRHIAQLEKLYRQALEA